MMAQRKSILRSVIRVYIVHESQLLKIIASSGYNMTTTIATLDFVAVVQFYILYGKHHEVLISL